MNINLEPRHVRVCQKWASMRRTLEEAARLIALSNPAHDDETIEACVWELSEIIPTIEAMQMAVREADNARQYLDDEKAALKRELYSALFKPFDEALPIVRKHINADFKVAFDERVAAWCVANSEAIALIMKEIKHARR